MRPMPYNIERFVFQLREFCIAQRIPIRWEADYWEEPTKMGFASLLLRWLAPVGGGHREVVQRERFPSTWWDHFKWSVLRRAGLDAAFSPPRFTEIEVGIEHWRVCPHLDIPDRMPHIEYLRLGSEKSWECGTCGTRYYQQETPFRQEK